MAKCESLVSKSCLKALSTWATVTSTVPFSNYEGMLATSFSAVRHRTDSKCGGYSYDLQDFEKPSAPYCASANLLFEQVNRYPSEGTNQVSKSALALDSCHVQFGSGHVSGFLDETGRIVQMDMSFWNNELPSQSFLLGKRPVLGFQSRESDYPNGRTSIVGSSKLASNTSCCVANDPNISAIGGQILLQVEVQPHTCSDYEPQNGILTEPVYDKTERQEICCCEICFSGLKDLESETFYDIHGSQVSLKGFEGVDTSKYEDYSLSAVVKRACCSPHFMVQQSQAQTHAEHWINQCTPPENVHIELQNENSLRNLHVAETRNSYEGDYCCCDESNFTLLRSHLHGNSVKPFFAMDQIGTSSFVANNSPGENMYLCPLHPQFGYSDLECNQVIQNFSLSSSNFEPVTNGTTLQPMGEIEIWRTTGFVVNSQKPNDDTRIIYSTSQEKKSVELIFECGIKSSVNSGGKRPAEFMKSFTPDKILVRNEEAILHGRDAGQQNLEKENQLKTIGKGFYPERPPHPPLQECLNKMASYCNVSLVLEENNGINLWNSGLELTLTDGATKEPNCGDSLTGSENLNVAFAFRRRYLNDSTSKSSSLARTPGSLGVSGTKSTTKITNRTRSRKTFMKQMSNASKHLTQGLSDHFSKGAVNHDSETEAVHQGFELKVWPSSVASKEHFRTMIAKDDLVTSDKNLHNSVVSREPQVAIRSDNLQEENQEKLDQVSIPTDKMISSAKMRRFGGCDANALRIHSIFDSHVVLQYPYSLDDILGEPSKILEGRATSPRLYI